MNYSVATPILMVKAKAKEKYLKCNAAIFMPYIVLVQTFAKIEPNAVLLYAIIHSASYVATKCSDSCRFWYKKELMRMFEGERKDNEKLVKNALRLLKALGHIDYRPVADDETTKDQQYQFTLKTYWKGKEGLIVGKPPEKRDSNGGNSSTNNVDW